MYWAVDYPGWMGIRFTDMLTAPVAGGTTTRLQTEQTTNNSLGAAANHAGVYWSPGDDLGSILAVPLDGGVPTTLAAGYYTDIAADEAYVYALTDPYDVAPDAATSQVARIPIDAGPPVYLAQSAAGGALVIDATYAYWATDTSVMRVPLGGGSVDVVACGQTAITGLAVNSTSVFWSAAYGGGGAIMQAPK